jgi:hypothetical protein
VKAAGYFAACHHLTPVKQPCSAHKSDNHRENAHGEYISKENKEE